MPPSESWVGDHHVNGLQCSVPYEVLEEAGFEKGDKLLWTVEDGDVVGHLVEESRDV